MPQMGLQAVMDQLAPVGVSRTWAPEAFMAVKMEVSGVTHVQDHQEEVAAMDPVEVEMEASVAQVDSALVPDGRVATGVAVQAVRTVDLVAQVEVRRALDLMAIRDRMV
jgi:hypothetical protein